MQNQQKDSQWKIQASPIPLSKGSGMYDLILEDSLQEKINYLCATISQIEWSGTLFYKVQGEFEGTEDNKLKITAIDLFLQDIGGYGNTEYQEDPDLIGYMCENTDLLEEGVFMGLIHSHHTMKAYFSPTDDETLRKEGIEKDHFLSLVVNNIGNYVARITRKIEGVRDIIESISYPSFFGVKKTASRTKQVSFTNVEYFDLNIQKTEGYANEELDARISDLRKKNMPSAGSERPSVTPIFTPNVPAPAIKDYPSEDTDVPDSPIPYDIEHFNGAAIDSLLKQLLTGSVLVSGDSKLDVHKFANTAKNLYKKRFDTFEEFASWAEVHIDFLIREAEDEFIMSNYGEDVMRSICAYDLTKKLETLPENEYIEIFIELLDAYID